MDEFISILLAPWQSHNLTALNAKTEACVPAQTNTDPAKTDFA